MAGDKFAGINIKWDYANWHCHISMSGYIKNLLIKFKHPHPTKPCLSPYKCLPISYGAKAQLTPEADSSELLDEHRKCRIQEIIGLLLYYARAVDNKLLVALSAIAARQSYATVATEQAVHLLLEALCTGLVTWSCAPMQMQAFSMRPTPAAARELTSSFRKMIRFHVSMVPYSPSPRSSSSLWLQLRNQNLQPFLSRLEK
jgi:hypothetical protein